MFDLPPLRHISTLRILPVGARPGEGLFSEPITDAQARQREPPFMPRLC
jgi:hypothetical protein